MGALGHMGRLIKAGRTLARHDALIPEPVEDLIPAPVRALRRVAAIRLPGESHLSEKDEPRAGRRLAHALTGLGPTFIKLGQFLATRADAVGPDVAEDLAALQDKLAPFPQEEAEAAVTSALGKPVSDLFASFGPAVAAASIAQVHKAETDQGAVAVKILRPGVEDILERDLAAFDWAARRAEAMIPELRRLRPVEGVATLAKSVHEELDLRLEAAALSEMAENVEGDEGFRVPAVDWQRTSQRVLTLEWIDGVPLSDQVGLDEAGFDRAQLADLYAESFLLHAMRDGLFHADMHPGNLFAEAVLNSDGSPAWTENGKVKARLVAVDFGIMGRLSRDNRRYLAEILYGVIIRDYERVAELHFEAGLVPPHHSVTEFAQALRSMGEPIFGQDAEAMAMGDLLGQLYANTEKFDMAMQPELLLLQKTMVVIEGVARRINPDFNLWETGAPILETFMMDQLGPAARLEDGLETLEKALKALADLPHMVNRLEAAAAGSPVTANGGLRPGNPAEWQRPRRGSLFPATIILASATAAALTIFALL